MKLNLKAFLVCLLLASCISIDFVPIDSTSQTPIELTSAIPLKYFVLSCPIENLTDTIIRFQSAELNPSKVKIYFYYTQQEAEQDPAFAKPRWTNTATAKELIAYLSFTEASLPKLFIAFSCVDCTEAYRDTFQITNELVDRKLIEVGKTYSFKAIYSRKLLLFKMNKTKKQIGFRFQYTPVKMKEITAETYFGSQLVSTLTSSTVIRLSRTEEYTALGEYQVSVKVNGEEANFELKVELTEFIQPELLEVKKEKKLNFKDALHDLYYYVDISEYELNEENTITFTVNQKEGQKVVPVIYSREAASVLPGNEYDQLVPKREADSIFKVSNRDKGNKYFMLYFKKTKEENNLLFVNVLFKEDIDVSVVLSPRSQLIDDTFLPKFSRMLASKDLFIPYRFIISSFKYGSNLLVFAASKNTHRIYSGHMLDEQLNLKPFRTSDLHLIQNKESFYATYEFFGNVNPIEFIFEITPALIEYDIDYTSNSQKRMYRLGTIGQTYYFIKSTTNMDKAYHVMIEQLTGKAEYLFKEKIDYASDITTLLPSADTDMSRGIEKLTTQFHIVGIKVISPCQVAISLEEDTPATSDLAELGQYSRVFVKDKAYKMTMPFIEGKEYAVVISSIQFHKANDEVKFQYKEQEITREHILKENSSITIPYKSALTFDITPTIESNSAISFILVDQAARFKEITASTTSITEKNVIMKLNEEDTEEYVFTLGKDLNFKYGIGIGESKLIPPAYIPTTSKEGETWLRLHNPMLESKDLDKGRKYHYLTMTFEDGPLYPVHITIQKTPLPQHDQIDKKALTQLTAGSTVSLVRSDDYTLLQKNLLIVASSCSPNSEQSMTVYLSKKEKVNAPMTKSRTVIDHINLNIPLLLKYSDNSGESKAMVSYNYINDEDKATAIKALEREILITNNANKEEYTWKSPSEDIKQFTVYLMKEGTNTSAMDNECYLKTLEGKKVNENKFSYAGTEGGNYWMSVVALNQKGVEISIISKPEKFMIRTVYSSPIWYYIVGALGVLLIIGGGIVGFLYYKKRRVAPDIKIDEQLIPATAHN